MKKIFCFIIAFIIVAVGITPVYASNFIVGTSNADEILESDKELIMSDSDDWLNEKTGFPIEGKTFAYDRAKCVFYRIDLFKNDYLNNELMKQYVKEDDVYALYELPVYFDDGTLIINLVKGYEISDENFEKLSDNEKEYFNSIDGRWHAQSHYVKNEHYDYISYLEEKLAEIGIDDADIYMIGGPTDALLNLIVICKDNNDAQFLILDNDDYSDKRLYSFDEIKQIADDTKEDDDESQLIGVNTKSNEEFNQGTIISVLVITVIIAALIITIVFKRKNKAAE